jgi:hypothetical protein
MLRTRVSCHTSNRLRDTPDDRMMLSEYTNRVECDLLSASDP